MFNQSRHLESLDGCKKNRLLLGVRDRGVYNKAVQKLDKS